MDLDRIARQLEQCLATQAEPPCAAYLFGSVARGEATERSDVDVAVLYGRPLGSGLAQLGLDLEGELERSVGRAVQLVVLDSAPPDLVHRVLRDGRIVFERDRAARIRFEVRARAEYLSHIVSDAHLGEPRTNRELFDRLVDHGWLDGALREPLRRMSGFRNILVHGYVEVDPAIVVDVVRHHLADLEAFVAGVRARLPRP